MALYMVQFAYTPQAWKQLSKNPEDRTAAVKTLLEQAGCRLESLYYSFGEYDGFLIIEAPNEMDAMTFILAALGPGHLRGTKTTLLIRPSNVVEAMRKAGTLSFRGPKE